jgi:hypothetical protein
MDIKEALSRDFVRVDEVARILSLALQSGKNVLLWGPAGHGKSEMVAAALATAANDSDVYVQSFGEGMDEATLWGGLDFRKLENDHVLQYFPDNSFLSREYAVFEELFDAPASVLLALKDTLTAKKLRKGSQSFAMKTKVIVALTNKAPGEISDLGPAAHALIERFPLQLEVKWPSYGSADYLELFRKVGPRLKGADLNGQETVLAEVMAKAGESGEIVSPRTAIHAIGVVKAGAALRGAAKVEKQDLLDLIFLPGMAAFAANLRQEIDRATERAQAESNLRVAEAKLAQLLSDLAGADTPIKALQCAKRLVVFQDDVAQLAVTDGLSDRRKRLRDSVAQKAMEAQQCALDNTRI